MNWLKKLFTKTPKPTASRYICDEHGESMLIHIKGFGDIDGRYCYMCAAIDFFGGRKKMKLKDDAK